MNMIVGMDTGGTHVDTVCFDGTSILHTQKNPSEELIHSIRSVFDTVEEAQFDTVERIVLGTTLVLNATLEERLPDCSHLLIPGPGLSPSLAFGGEENIVVDGAVDHRGRVTEEMDYQEAVSCSVAAVTGKFSVRNPRLEEQLAERIDLPESSIALGSESGGGLGFPARARTTVFNAKSGPVFDEFTDAVLASTAVFEDPPTLYFMKGDGAIMSEETARKVPAQTVRSGPVVSAVGLSFLADEQQALCIDIGGTTTDITMVQGGYPVCEEGKCQVGDLSTHYRAVKSVDLVVGGDTTIRNGELTGIREGSAVAFGGDEPTLTDALHVTGDYEKGDRQAARRAMSAQVGNPEETAEKLQENAVSMIVESCEKFVESCSIRPEVILIGGVLAPFFAKSIQQQISWEVSVCVPEHHAVAGAVGCAVSQVQVAAEVHIDTARGYKQISGLGQEIRNTVPEGKMYSKKEIAEIAELAAVEMVKKAGGTGQGKVQILHQRSFPVVEQGRRKGQIIDLGVQLQPVTKSV